MTKCVDKTDAANRQGWSAICQLEKGHKGQHSNSKEQWGEEVPPMTPEEKTIFMAHFLGWELVDAFEPDELTPNPPKEWKGSGGKVPVGDYMTDSSDVFDPLHNLNHTVMVWAKLSDKEMVEARRNLTPASFSSASKWSQRFPTLLVDSALNPLALSNAIISALRGS